MKINRITIVLLLLVCLVFDGCQKDEDKVNYDLLQGSWINTMVNGEEVLTDDIYILKFNSNGTETHCNGFILDDVNKRWLEDPDYSFSISGDQICIDGVGQLGDTYNAKLSVIALDNEIFSYSIESYIWNGEEISDPCTYSCSKITDDLDDAFTGVWYGRCTTIGNADSLYHYWEYFDDGSYNYYYQDEDENWIKKSDNEGRYFLYGQYLATNYSFDLISGGTGLAYECWNIDIQGDSMTWSGVRAGEYLVNYEMERVASPPEILF